jgi:hypothetical protein
LKTSGVAIKGSLILGVCLHFTAQEKKFFMPFNVGYGDAMETTRPFVGGSFNRNMHRPDCGSKGLERLTIGPALLGPHLSCKKIAKGEVCKKLFYNV